MDNKIKTINLYRKIICSLACIEKKTKIQNTREKTLEFINDFIQKYDSYLNNSEIIDYDAVDVINFCNNCYEEVEIFDYAEDVEYGVKELYLDNGGKHNG